MPTAPLPSPGFSLDCELGVATAATQIEGGHADTIWHRWAATGAARDHSTPDVAADHWNRVEADADLMASLGIRHYRLGLEWARIEPDEGRFAQDALGHYRRELGILRDRGITPLVTLHHFNDPGWFGEAGGFLADGAHETFVRYAERVVEEVGDLADEWITINEPNVFGYNGYYLGCWPPGRHTRRDMLAAFTGLAHAHIAAYQRIHVLQPHARVGVANHLRVFDPAHPRNPLDRAAAASTEYLFQGALTRALCRGRFMAPLVQPKGVRPGTYYDFLGINYYSRGVVSGPNQATASRVPVNDLGWEIHPAGLVELARRYSALYPGPIYITENGTADAADAFRARYLYDHLKAIAAASDVPIERYYHWTFTDNWEWAEGQTARFGLVALDFETQERTVRESGRFYADVIANRGVTPDAHGRWVAPTHYRTNA
jgi:beta-glucosidase